jgi:hypothetical protein
MNWEHQQVVLSGMCSRYLQPHSLVVAKDSPQTPIISTVLDAHYVAATYMLDIRQRQSIWKQVNYWHSYRPQFYLLLRTGRHGQRLRETILGIFGHRQQ